MSDMQVKRLKTSDDTIEWKCTFDQTQGLRTMIEVVGNILTRVNLRLTREKNGASFMCIDSIDPQHVCMIQARLICEKMTDLPSDTDFCVESNILNMCLKGIPSHYSLDIYKLKDVPDIHINAYESLSNSHQLKFTIPTLVDDSESMQLSDMSYNYTIEIDLGTLRQIIKMSMQLRAQEIEMIVREPNNTEADILRTVFTIGAHGDAHQEHSFFSATVQESGAENTRIIRAATDATGPDAPSDQRLVDKYHDSFSCQYLNFFLKSMERQIITMKLSQDKPLILHYPLGAEKSYICFVLAPKTPDE